MIARPVAFTDREEIHKFVDSVTEDGSVVYTDEAAAYQGMPARSHWTVRHSANEFVRGMAHTNGIESFWSVLKRGLHGTYHHVSVKHLGRYVDEFSFRMNEGKRQAAYDEADRLAGEGRSWKAAHLRAADPDLGAVQGLVADENLNYISKYVLMISGVFGDFSSPPLYLGQDIQSERSMHSCGTAMNGLGQSGCFHQHRILIGNDGFVANKRMFATTQK